MIGTIRKHSTWLWWVVAGLTILSFIIFMGQGGARYGNGGAGGLGSLYGKPVTLEQLYAAKREFLIWYWMTHDGQFPKSPAVSEAEIDRGAYERLMLEAKAKQLGIHVTPDAEAIEANQFLSSLSRDRKPVPPNAFVDQVLTPAGLSAADFERTMKDDLIIQQLAQIFGLAGELVSPQEAGQLYDHDHQEYSAQAVLFQATNYLSQVSVTPAAVDVFYTNHMAEYRLPERVQLNYVAFDLSNYLAAAEQSLGKTNITAKVDAVFAQRGMEAAPGAATPEEAKAKIRNMLVRDEAAKTALAQARQFCATLFALEPAKPNPNDLLLLAKTNGLPAYTTAPFDEVDGPAEFPAPADLVRTAFKLNADSPFGPKPILGAEAVYVISLAKQIPSEVQPFSEIRGRVMDDFKNYEGTLRARAAGTNFYYNALVAMATGKTFAQVALANGQTPIALKPFSLSSTSIPQVEGSVDPRQLLYVASQTQPGHISPFAPTADGGFVLYVQSLLPVNEAEKNSQLPEYLARMRHTRVNETFNSWLRTEENRELQTTPIPQELASEKNARNP